MLASSELDGDLRQHRNPQWFGLAVVHGGADATLVVELKHFHCMRTLVSARANWNESSRRLNEPSGLGTRYLAVHNSITVKIIYPNGMVKKAHLLSHQGATLRAAVSGEDDVCELTRMEWGWITEEWEPVTVEFEWQRNLAAEVSCEEDYICSKELAAMVKAKLLHVPAEEDAPGPELYVFAADGTRIRIRRSQLTIH